MGIVDLGRGIYTYNGVNQAARELARVTSVHLCDTSAPTCTIGTSPETAHVAGTQAKLVPGLGGAGSTVTYACTTVTDVGALLRELPVRLVRQGHGERAVLGHHAIPRRLPAQLAVVRHPRPDPVKELAMHIRRLGRGEDGQMLVIFAICLVAIIAMTGLVIDGGLTYVQRREQQNVADAAALAGAYAYVNSANQGDAAPAAQAAAAANGFTTGADGVTVDVTTSMVGGAIEVTATVTKPHRNYFSGIMGFNELAGHDDRNLHRRHAQRRAWARCRSSSTRRRSRTRSAPGRRCRSDEPGNGNEDVPQTASQFNWTVFCTANGGGHGGCNGNSSTVRDLINNRGHSTVVKLDDDIGPLNAGSHTTLFSDLADLVGTDHNEFPVAIVNDDGTMVGWAMFHLTGSVGGSTKQIRGYFVSPVNRGVLKIVQGAGRRRQLRRHDGAPHQLAKRRGRFVRRHPATGVGTCRSPGRRVRRAREPRPVVPSA